MIRDSSRVEAPTAKSERMSRPGETEGPPASILAIRDWLDLSALARATWVKRRRRRRSLRLWARRSLSSMYAAPSFDSPSNSLGVPTLHPFASSRRFLASRILVELPELSLAGLNHRFRGRPGPLAENLQDDDCVRGHVVDDPPRGGH